LCVARKNLNTKPTIKPRDRYSADLIDLSSYKTQNDGSLYLLVVVDCFSKYAITEPLKNKNAQTTLNAFIKIFCYIREPLILHTDNGREFKNKKMKTFCDENGIRQIFGRPRCPLNATMVSGCSS
jgi:transposase InsO family protein